MISNFTESIRVGRHNVQKCVLAGKTVPWKSKLHRSRGLIVAPNFDRFLKTKSSAFLPCMSFCSKREAHSLSFSK